MKKTLILSIGIIKIKAKKQFFLEDNFNKLQVDEMSAVIGMLSSILHNYWHIHSEEHNKLELNNKIKN